MTAKTVLIGNGPSAADSLRGVIIDGFDCVVRCNSYVTSGYEGFVGSKTDVWAVNEGYVSGELKPPNPRPAKTLIAVAWWKPTEGCLWQRLDDTWPHAADLIDEEAARMISWPSHDKWASTGLLALHHFALQEPVAIVGFDCFSEERQHHYWNEGRFCGNHDPILEWALVERLIRLGRVIRL